MNIDLPETTIYPEYQGKFADFEGGTEEERTEEIQRLKGIFISEEDTLTDEDERELENEIEALENLKGHRKK